MLNFSKCELFIVGYDYMSVNESRRAEIIFRFCLLAPYINIIALSELGAPILNESIPAFINHQIAQFPKTSDHLS